MSCAVCVQVEIQCDTPEHERVKLLAFAAILIYPIGVFAMNAFLLFVARKSIKVAMKRRKHTGLSHALLFLYRECT